MEIYLEMRESLNNCCTASNSLYESIRSRSDINSRVKFYPKNKDSNTFIIEFILPDDIRDIIDIRDIRDIRDINKMTISFPLNKVGNNGSPYNEVTPSTVEMLFDGICITYYDVIIDDVVREIIHMSDYLLTSPGENYQYSVNNTDV